MRNPVKSDVDVMALVDSKEISIEFSVDINKDDLCDLTRVDEIDLIGADGCRWSKCCTLSISNEAIRIAFSRSFPISKEEIQNIAYMGTLPSVEPYLENVILILPSTNICPSKSYRLARDNVFQSFQWVINE